MNRILLIAAIFSAALISCKDKKEETVLPVIAPIAEAVFAPGHIEAGGQFTLTAMNDGYLEQVTVQEGDNVSANQVLLVQDNAPAAVQQQTATENLGITQQLASPNSAVLQQLQAQLDAANAKLQNDKTQLGRMQRLYNTNSVAKTDVDNAQLGYDNSVSNVAAIVQNMEATKLNLRQAVVNNRGQQQSAMVANSYYNIKSTGSYKVYSLLKKKGDMVRKGEAVAILGDADNLKVKLSIDEASIAKIKLRQKVLVELNTEKGITYTARVAKIYPAFDAASQSYTVDALFDTTATHIINGTLLQANIIVATKAAAMLLPRNCLGANNSVLVKRDNKTDTVLIKTGIVSNDWVEVLSGLQTSDKVVKL